MSWHGCQAREKSRLAGALAANGNNSFHLDSCSPPFMSAHRVNVMHVRGGHNSEVQATHRQTSDQSGAARGGSTRSGATGWGKDKARVCALPCLLDSIPD